MTERLEREDSDGAAPDRVVTLDAIPSLSASYGSVLTRSARLAVVRPVTAGTLPEVTLRAPGVRAGREHLDAWCRVVGERSGDTLPPGYVHTLAFGLQLGVMTRADFPLPALGLVHAANRVVVERPLAADAELEIRCWATRLRSRGAGSQVELAVSVSDADGVAYTASSTYLARRTRIAGLEPASVPMRTEFAPPEPTAQWSLGAAVAHEYAAVSGDRNPIHTSRLAARAFGFPRTLAHGMYTASRAHAAIGAARPEAHTWDVTFASPVLLPARVALRIASDAEVAGGWSTTAWDAVRAKPHLFASVLPLA